jgi:hypothetical protein
MFPVKLLPMFIIGCAALPDGPAHTETRPGDGPDDTPSDVPTDESSDQLSPQLRASLDETLFEQPDSVPPEPSDFDTMNENEVRNSIIDDLNRLQGLEIVEVGDVILDLPAEAVCAYFWTPCAGFEDQLNDALRQVAPRLEALADAAEVADEDDDPARSAACSESVIADNLDVLSGLEIVSVGDLLVAEPERNCPYSMPCEEDIIAAEDLTCERAITLDKIVLATSSQ